MSLYILKHDTNDIQPFGVPGELCHGAMSMEKGALSQIPQLRLSTASYHLFARGPRFLEPDFWTKDVQGSGLPELGDKKFFYYFGEDVGREMFDRMYTLTALKRASLLKMVRLF